MSVLLATDPTQLYSFIGIGVKETEATFGGGSAARFARFR